MHINNDFSMQLKDFEYDQKGPEWKMGSSKAQIPSEFFIILIIIFVGRK